MHARPTAVHPLQPRFAQAITGVICLEALVFSTWPAILVALALVLVALLSPRWSPVNWIFRRMAPPPSELEPVAPVRFSQWLAVGFLTLASALFLAGADMLGWIVVAAVALVALISAISGFCIGCEVYRMILGVRSGDNDVRAALGLSGSGPWVAVLTAPGCARCEPTVQRVRAASPERPVEVINLAQRPTAAGAPVKSVPAVLAVGSDGHVMAARAGEIDDAAIGEVLAAV
jgi:hypothetical protein